MLKQTRPAFVSKRLKMVILTSLLVCVCTLLATFNSPLAKVFFPDGLSCESFINLEDLRILLKDIYLSNNSSLNPCPAIVQDREMYRVYLPFVESNSPFRFKDGRLSIDTQLMELTIEGGAITYVRDKASGEVLVNTNAYSNRPPVAQGFVGFTSTDRDANNYLRWPTQASSVSFSKLGTDKVRLTYTPLYFDDIPSDSQLLVDLTIDEASGEVIVQLTGVEADPALKPFTLDCPVMNMKTPAVILGSGAKYLRSDAEATDQSAYSGLGLYSPTMAVVQGTGATLAVWSETTQFAPEYVQLEHKRSYDHLILHSEQDPKQMDPQKIVSPPWRIGTYPTWVEAARRWREKFEERTSAKPLWENRTPWVRNIHAMFDGTNEDYETDEARYAELASKAPPEKVLYFIWNGDRIVLHGDHTLLDEVGRPTPDVVDIIKRYGWPLIIFHPYTLIHSETGAADRLQYLADQGWLPASYQFNPDYEGTPENWQHYWSEVKANYFSGSEFYILHPGSAKFRDYLVRNFNNYCAFHRVNGAYLDISGDDNNPLFPDDRKVIEGRDYVLGEIVALAKVARELPRLGVMSEYQSPWVLPYAFYSWEGTSTHIRQNVHANTRINHPLRVALTGSYSWTRESNEEDIDDVIAALMGTLPAISLVGDYNVSEERATWSQARARLFCDEELFNDLPDEWDQDALAYYRSKSGHWFKFRRSGAHYEYVEILPSGEEIIRLSK
jgi:hypothetical protein